MTVTANRADVWGPARGTLLAVLAAAALLPVVFAAVTAAPATEIGALTTAALVTWAAQAAVLWWSAFRPNAAPISPVPLTARITAAFALVTPIASIGASIALGLGPIQLVSAHATVFTGTQIAFLWPFYITARSAVRAAGFETPGPRSTTNTLLITVVLAAASSALLLVLGADLLTRRCELARGQESLGAAVGAVALWPTPLEPDRASQIAGALTRFDRVSAFSFQPGVAVGISATEVSAVELALRTGQHATPGVNSGRSSLTWHVLGDGVALLGARLAAADSARALRVLISLLIAVVLVSAMLALWRGSRFDRHLASIAAHIDALPDGTPPGPPTGATPAIDAVLGELKLLDTAFDRVRTKQRAAIESGRQARELKAGFFASMSHDLRTPLNSVVGFTDVLLRGLDGPLEDAARERVRAISRDAERLLVLVENILETSKADAGHFDINPSWVPAVEILTDCAATVRRLIGSKEVELVTEFEPGLPPVYVDNARIRQAIIALINQALSLMDRGTLRLRAARDRGSETAIGALRVDIIDGGRSIPEEAWQRIVAAFDSSAARDDHGAARLGSALARDIVRLHGGVLEVEREWGRGSLFSFTLPLDEPPGEGYND